MMNKKFQMLFVTVDSFKELLTLNAFGAMRLSLATIVVLHHSLVLSGNGKISELGLSRSADLGTLGVAGFFAVSGFLLAGSSARLSPKQFFMHRFFRLFPGLWLCLIVSAFIVVPIANRLSTYVSSFSFIGENSSLSYVFLNAALVGSENSVGVGTVFAQNEFPVAINGSLWTLIHEFICYLGLLAVAVIAPRSSIARFLLIATGLFASSSMWFVTQAKDGDRWSQILNPASGLAVAFCSGALIAILAEFRPIRPRFIPSSFALIVWITVGADGPLSIMLLSLIVLSISLSLTNPILGDVGRDTDISYGVYLYHFPVIQTILVSNTYSWSVIMAMTVLPALALLIVGPIALISWRFIEKPSISFARTLKRR